MSVGTVESPGAVLELSVFNLYASVYTHNHSCVARLSNGYSLPSTLGLRLRTTVVETLVTFTEVGRPGVKGGDIYSLTTFLLQFLVSPSG